MKKKTKKKLLNAITAFAGLIFIFSVSAVDSDSWIPFITLIVSGAWLALVAWANGKMYPVKVATRNVHN